LAQYLQFFYKKLVGICAMGDVVQLNPHNHFGDCPECRKNDGHINVGRVHWFVCKRHRVKWKAGHDIFPDWKQENLQVWRQNEKLLELFTEVEPLQAWKKTELEEMFAALSGSANQPLQPHHASQPTCQLYRV
jgi:hypothetical protein